MFYVGMLFFSLAIASGLWGFASVGPDVDPVARLIFYTSLFAASVAFAACLLRSRARGDASNEDESRGAAPNASSVTRTSALRSAEEPDVSDSRSKPVARSAWRSTPGAVEGWGAGGAVRASDVANGAQGGIGQEV